ncbi:unnamed protein product [Vitrella brassicaformis CCMP3155]|uniref:Uncharacterized protein n=1 Tax=Vitrella brassicaformis (strain CCMP3155) TaxID=1169540 RepID=A0A0G4GGM3_VITBC|nr:unnamed protein product [Vitrella brassicaformis CCMP3155]|eukprot:CEM28778.1 unnamed protein product [Vitrella brassicaformis CCMP3155]
MPNVINGVHGEGEGAHGAEHEHELDEVNGGDGEGRVCFDSLLAPLDEVNGFCRSPGELKKVLTALREYCAQKEETCRLLRRQHTEDREVIDRQQRDLDGLPEECEGLRSDNYRLQRHLLDLLGRKP